MKKFLLILLLSPFISISQDIWNGSSISTSTNGGVGIGTSPVSTASLKISNTSRIYGIHNENNLSSNATQYGLYNSLNSSSAIGIKYGVYSQVSGSSTFKYGVYASAVSSGSYGGGTNQPATSYALYAIASGAATRAGYFSGDVEMYNSNTIFSSINGNKSLIMGAMYGTDPIEGYKLIFALNKTNNQYDWDWSTTLELHRGGAMVKRANSANKTFSIHRFDLDQEVFRIYGDGRVYATEINVRMASNFPDYVFSSSYDLMDIKDLDKYIKQNGKLPNMPSANTVEEEGLDIGETSRLLVEKIEELTLYIIKQQELIEKQEYRLKELEEKLK